MIRQLAGTVQTKEETSIIVDVVGFGILVHMTTRDAETPKEGSLVRLHTHLVVREDGVALYGFHTKDDLSFFSLLTTVSGVGPKTALGIMERAGTAILGDAIRGKRADYLSSVLGIGKKMAAKLVAELSDKIPGTTTTDLAQGDGDVVAALVALGYTEREAREAAQRVPLTIEGRDARIRAALRTK